MIGLIIFGIPFTAGVATGLLLSAPLSLWRARNGRR